MLILRSGSIASRILLPFHAVDNVCGVSPNRNDLAYYERRKMGESLVRPFDPSVHTARSYRRVLDRVGGLAADASVLDICCGLGSGSHFLGGKVRRVVGVDHSTEAISFATEHYTLPGRVEFLAADVMHLDLDEKFDAAIMVDVIEHFSTNDAVALLRRVSGLLRPNGEIVVHLPLGDTPAARFRRFYKGVKTGIDHTGDPTHLVAYDLTAALEVCHRAGLEVRRWMCKYAAPPIPAKWMEALALHVSASPRTTLANAMAISVDLRLGI
jgi:SAM-dependent methyltransferase